MHRCKKSEEIYKKIIDFKSICTDFIAPWELAHDGENDNPYKKVKPISYKFTNELAYGLHWEAVATRELACAADWEASQGRCSKLVIIFETSK